MGQITERNIMPVKNSLLAIPLTSLNAAAVAIGFAPVNPNGLAEPCVILRIINDQTMPITISYDGLTDHDYLPARGILQINAQTNSLPKGNICRFNKGSIIYVAGVAGVGNVVVAGYYQPAGA